MGDTYLLLMVRIGCYVVILMVRVDENSSRDKCSTHRPTWDFSQSVFRITMKIIGVKNRSQFFPVE